MAIQKFFGSLSYFYCFSVDVEIGAAVTLDAIVILVVVVILVAVATKKHMLKAKNTYNERGEMLCQKIEDVAADSVLEMIAAG